MLNYPGFDMTDPNMIRLLAQGLELYLTGNRRRGNNPAIRRMDAIQQGTMQRILGIMTRDQCFNGLVGSLIDLYNESDKVVVRLAAEMLIYDDPKEGEPAIEDNEYEAVESEADESETEDSDEENEGPNMPDIEHDGYRVVWDSTTMNSNFARPGVPEPSYYKITIPLQKETFEGSGVWVNVPSIEYDYLTDHHAPSWESSRGLYKFNQWRNQIFRKYLGNKQLTRDPWLVSEQQRIVHLLKQQLGNPHKIPKRPKWGRLANTYNRQLHRTIQDKGSQLVQTGVKKIPTTDYDRFAPWRSKGAIQNIVKKGTWLPLIEPILRDALERRRAYEANRAENVYKSDHSKDDEEIPNPDGPKSKDQIRATNAARREARRKDSARKEKEVVQVDTSAGGDDDDEDGDVRHPWRQ